MTTHRIDIKNFVLSALIFLFGAVGGAIAQTADSIYIPQTLSPFDFGLAEATTDSARYTVLYNTHLQAVNIGAEVSYRGVGALTIEVTQNAQPIPLGRRNDFGGVLLTIKNNAKPHYLFSMADSIWNTIELGSDSVDDGALDDREELSEGIYLLVIEDLHPWVANRAGYSYGAMRKDILLVKDNHTINHPISPYSTDSTDICVKYHRADEELKTIANLTITRDTTATAKTYCFDIEGVNNLKISNINIYTPDTKNMYADAAINIRNCTNVTLEDVHIEGTYSRTNLYGYGIQMDNVWNSSFIRLSARANWGIFGTNNISKATLRDCTLNRFDIHCYGRDIAFHNCTFGKLYNQFSSIFGTLLFDGCRFTDFVPVLIETSYNAYTAFDLTFKDCIFDALPRRNFLVSIGKVDNQQNSRPELAEKCWPNVTIKNMTVNVANKVSKVILFEPKTPISSNVSVDYISAIKIDGLKFHYADTSHLADFVISNKTVKSSNSINYDMKKVTLIPTTKQMKRQAVKKYSYPGSLIFKLRHSKSDKINIADSRLNYNVNENSSYNIKYTDCEIGMIRYNSTSNGTKRNYNHCTLYLNNADDARYYIDNQAIYYKSTFVPCDSRMLISFYGSNNSVSIRDCKTTRKGKLFYHGSSDNRELKDHKVVGTAK